MKRVLIIDDIRNATRSADAADANDILFDHDDQVIICRDFFSGLACLQHLPPFDLLLLDRDLGSFDGGQEKTGEDILTWLHSNPGQIPAEIRIVSANIIRRPAMELSAHQLMSLKP